MTIKSLLNALVFGSVCNGAHGDPAMKERTERVYREVREQAHSAANQAAATHALVVRKQRTIQMAEDALALMRGEELR